MAGSVHMTETTSTSFSHLSISVAREYNSDNMVLNYIYGTSKKYHPEVHDVAGNNMIIDITIIIINIYTYYSTVIYAQ